MVEDKHNFDRVYLNPRVFLALTIAVISICILGVLLYVELGKKVSMLICSPLLFAAMALFYAYMNKLRTSIQIKHDSIRLIVPTNLSLLDQGKVEKKLAWKEILDASMKKRWGLFILNTHDRQYKFLLVDSLSRCDKFFDLVQSGIDRSSGHLQHKL